MKNSLAVKIEKDLEKQKEFVEKLEDSLNEEVLAED